ncbi:hypothetical protein SVIOM74S_02697 [Streptomyces violarus]
MTVDGRPLHLMRRADGSWLSMVDHYRSYPTPLAAARGAVDELGPGEQLRDTPAAAGQDHSGGTVAYTRKDVTTLTRSEKRRFVKALLEVKRRGEGRPRRRSDWAEETPLDDLPSLADELLGPHEDEPDEGRGRRGKGGRGR